MQKVLAKSGRSALFALRSLELLPDTERLMELFPDCAPDFFDLGEKMMLKPTVVFVGHPRALLSTLSTTFAFFLTAGLLLGGVIQPHGLSTITTFRSCPDRASSAVQALICCTSFLCYWLPYPWVRYFPHRSESAGGKPANKQRQTYLGVRQESLQV